ncbi:NAD(P) transhydrogenase subunit alpha [Paucilactobacillus nenjiangensis]|jgi:NAD(P) transhydrogenase subunit alpha|uniref:proton-translocating NAD(P)(+) transhydrogenase n=1 Tax=Paucilactobacillus nenjiangensis TaxID=1296540 RepID=A0A5P1X110_9LACO|nr:NAD(P) transhydrogenase subunit alpha [Paucilactobacillus nenjiangensis]QER66574.1 NAD(P) transhydrogenase subunit alpha [Paucilactobacillus nenjiangensis]
MSQELYTNVAIFVMSVLVGFEVISKIPATLHTPMMSGANAIHGAVVIGAILIALEAQSPLFYGLAFIAVFLGSVNVAGGYVVTDRMLTMFSKPKKPKNESDDGGDK